MDNWAKALKEPSLDEMFAEPIIQMIMQRDGIRPNDMREKLDAASGQRSKFRF